MKLTLLLSFIATILAHKTYNCMFNELYAHSNHYQSKAKTFYEDFQITSSRRNLAVSGRQPMRITLNTDDLQTVIASANGESQTTTTRLNFLKKSIQVARSFYQNRLQVIPEANIKSPAVCFDYDTPTADTTTGISTDLIVYVTYLTDSTIGYGATGVSCSWLDDSATFPDTSFKSHRPVVGRMIYNTYQIVDSLQLTNMAFSAVTATSIHQFLHILGFDQSLYQYYMSSEAGNQGNKYSSITVEEQLHASRTGGKSDIMILPNVLEWTLDHFGCATVSGMPLQNEEGSGAAVGSHWERLSMYDELMTGTAMGSRKAFTGLTFALLKDMGWYGVDGSFNDTTNYGKDLGCDFYNDACYGSTRYPKYFCDATAFDGVTQCDTNFLGKSYCYQEPALMADGCGMFFEVWSCVDPDAGIMGYEANSLQSYGTDSFCVKSTLNTRGIPDEYRGRCYPYTCDLENTKIVFTIGDYTATCFKIDAGIQKSVDGLSGYLQCPKFDDFCVDGRKTCKNWCSQKGFCMGGICNCYETDTIAYSGEDCSITTCTSSQYYDPSTASCVSVCPDGRYGNKFSRTCMPCSEDCSICRDQPQICTGCKPIGGVTYYFVTHSSQCVTECPDGTYQTGQYCQLCDDSAHCKTCTGSATSCTSCINTDPSNVYYLDQSSYSCNQNCIDGSYYKKDTVNFICQQTCPLYLYYDSANTKCITCNPWYKKIDEQETDVCIQTCPAQYYPNQAQYSCDKCHTDCLECDGGYAQNCTKCKTNGTLLFLHLHMCLQSCMSGYYQNVTAGQCVFCPAELNCNTCYMDDTSDTVYCKTCIYGYFFQVNETCTAGCDSHKYKNTWNQSCDDCHDDCNDCTSPKESSCLNCNSPAYLIKNISGSYCVEACPTQGFVTFAATTCQSCHETCKSCTGLTSADCTQCTDDLYLEDGLCRYVCSPGKYTDATTKSCMPCDEKCSFCFGNTADNCTKCEQPYVLDNNTCTSSCPEGQSANAYNICDKDIVNTTFENKLNLYLLLLAVMLANLW